MKTALLLILLTVASTASAEMYTWQDNRGTVFYTNSLHEIPAKYLPKAKLYDVATGKKGGLATAQPVAPVTAQHAASPAQQAPAALEPAAAAAPVPAPVSANVNGIATNPAAPSPADAVAGLPTHRPRGTLAERRARKRRAITGDPPEE